MRNIVNAALRGLTGALMLMTGASAVAADAVVPLDISGPRPTAQLAIAAAPPVTVIFDTGAGGSVLNTALGRTHNLPNEGDVHISSPGAQSRIPAFLSKLPQARLGDADVTGGRVIVGDLGVPLPGISGVMSPNIFKGSLVRFELKTSRVVVLEKSAANMPARTSYPYHGDHPLPSIQVDVAGLKLQAHLDTGSGHAFGLPLELVDQIPLKAPLTPTKPVKMAGGERKTFIARIKGTVRIGPITLTDPEVMFVERSKYANVGFSILKDLTLVLDPAEQRSWLLPGE